VFCPNRNVLDTMLQFNGLAGLPYPPTCNKAVIYLSTLENTLQNRPSWKCKFFTA